MATYPSIPLLQGPGPGSNDSDFSELRKILKKQNEDTLEINEKILNVLKDNNDLLNKLISISNPKITSEKITKTFKRKNDSEKETEELKEDVIETFGNLKDFVLGTKKRIQEYKEFFFGKSEAKKSIEKKIITPKTEKIPEAKFLGKGEQMQIYSPGPIPIEVSKPKTPLLESPKKKYENVIDVTPIETKTPLL